MLNPLPSSSHNRFRPIRLIGFMSMLGLLAVACLGGTPNPATPTPTTAAGGIPSAAPSSTAPSSTTPIPASTSAVNATNVCALVSQSEAQAVIGSAIIATKPSTDATSIPGGISYFCTYLGTGVALITSVVDMGSPAAALQEVNTLVNNMRTSSPSAIIAQESGLGDRVFWTATANGCGYNVVKGRILFSVSLGGSIGDPSSHKAALKSLAQTVAGRL